jgi:hypothetical protein
MSLLLSLLVMAVVSVVLVAGSVIRRMGRSDHRCRVVTRSGGCERCAAVLRGQDRGGHMVCACGAASTHLTGAPLLRWRAEHHGDPFPAIPGSPATRDARPRSTTRGWSARQAESRAAVAMMEGVGEAERRAIARARRNPDPITPQLLREARGGDGEDAAGQDAGTAPSIDGEQGG